MSSKGGSCIRSSGRTDLDYSGQRVVVIGSGATAVTLVPAMARTAEHVTMLQRTPSYVASRPAHDAFSDRLRAVLPEKLAHRVIRGKNVALSTAVYSAFRKWPAHAAWLLNSTVAKQLPESIPVDPHFTPRYKPWDQRLCLVPDADLFEVLRDGSASVVTDEIETFTPTGLRLRSGQELRGRPGGHRDRPPHGCPRQHPSSRSTARPVDPHDTFVYKGMMLSGVPNLAWCIGYTNNSWTLRSDLTSQYVCRLLNHLAATGTSICVPEIDPAEYDAPPRPVVDLSSGYIRRAAAILPRQGSTGPWRLRQNYPRDLARPSLQPGRRRHHAVQTRRLTPYGTGTGGCGPTYVAIGRMILGSVACSRMLADQPITRLTANVGVNIARGTPHSSITTPA